MDNWLIEIWDQAIKAEKANQMVDPTWVLLLVNEIRHLTNLCKESERQVVELRQLAKRPTA